MNTQSIVTDEVIIDRVFSRSQTEGEEHNASNSDIETEMLQDMRYDFAEEISVQKSNRLAEIKLQVESDRQRNEKQTNEYYASMIDNLQRFIRSWESDIEMLFNVDEKRVQQFQGAIRLAQARIQLIEMVKEARLELFR